MSKQADPTQNVYKLVKQAIKGVYNMMRALEKRVIEKLDDERSHSSELREAMKDASKSEILSAVARAEALAKPLEELVKRVSAIEVAQSQNQGKGSGVQSLWSVMVMVILALTSIISVIFLFLKK